MNFNRFLTFVRNDDSSIGFWQDARLRRASCHATPTNQCHFEPQVRNLILHGPTL